MKTYKHIGIEIPDSNNIFRYKKDKVYSTSSILRTTDANIYWYVRWIDCGGTSMEINAKYPQPYLICALPYLEKSQHSTECSEVIIKKLCNHVFFDKYGCKMDVPDFISRNMILSDSFDEMQKIFSRYDIDLPKL